MIYLLCIASLVYGALAYIGFAALAVFTSNPEAFAMAVLGAAFAYAAMTLQIINAESESDDPPWPLSFLFAWSVAVALPVVSMLMSLRII